MKTSLPYFVLISSILDGLFLGAVLLHLSPSVVMPVWYGSGAVLCVALYLLKYRNEKIFYGFRNHWIKIAAFYFFSILSGVCWMFAVYHLGLSISTVMDQAHYVLIILWGVLILKEPFSKHMALSTLSGKINHNTIIVTRALLMMAGASGAHLYLNDGSFIGYDFEPYLWFLLIVGGMIGAGLNHHLSLAALKFTSLSHYILIQMLEPMLMLLAGVLLYQDIITPLQFLVIGIVLIGKLVLARGKWKEKIK